MHSLDLTRGQPFCAGSLVLRRGRVVLAAEEPVAGRKSLTLRGIGGGAELGEGPVETALREAREEIGAQIDLVAPLGSLWWDEHPETCETVHDVAVPPAFVIGRKRRSSPEPWAPGFPGGPHLYLVNYLAVAEGALTAGTDQLAILLFPPAALLGLRPEGEWSMEEVLGWGVEAEWRDGAPPPGTRLRLPEWEELLTCAAEALRRGLVPEGLLRG